MLWKKKLENRVQELERKTCSHSWTYYISSYGYTKKCELCGSVYIMSERSWLQEQADLHYKKHCEMIEMINKEQEEE